MVIFFLFSLFRPIGITAILSLSSTTNQKSLISLSLSHPIGTAIPSLSSTTDQKKSHLSLSSYWHNHTVIIIHNRQFAAFHSRFVRTLDKPDFQIKDPTICQAVASTLKVHVKQVEAIVQVANKSLSSSTLSTRTCSRQVSRMTPQ